MKRSTLLAAALSLFLAFSSLIPASAASSSAPTLDARQPSQQQYQPAPDADRHAGERWIYADNMLVSRLQESNTAAAQSAAMPFPTRAIDWQWRAASPAPASGADRSAASLDRFTLIALDRADIAGNHDALIFAVLSVVSGLICFSRRKASVA